MTGTDPVKSMADDRTQLSIGALSRATGVPAETLRTWERRYGFPASNRTESGHRRYPLSTVERLRLVTRAMQLGHRPSDVLSADEEALREILAQAGVSTEVEPGAEMSASGLERWFEHVERFEGRALDRELRSSLNELGARLFARERVAPFLTELGARWERGELGVGHEHFASERLREFLAAQWRPMSDAATGPTYVLSTLPDEQHVLGLHLAALTVAQCGGRVVFLGGNSPLSEIARTAAFHGAEAVLLSAARGCDGGLAEAHLHHLRQLLPPEIALGIGGGGACGLAVDVPVFETLDALEDWLCERLA